MPEKRLPLLRWVAEFMLIVGSVYLAVYLEGRREDAEEHAQAEVLLAQVLGELQEDLQDFDHIIAEQTLRDVDYTNLRRWLTSTRERPLDSLRTALYMVSTENSTLFPRKASWTTMVSSGFLAHLDAPDLVLQLGQLYETKYARIDYNSLQFDVSLNEGFVSHRGIRWQTLNSNPLSPDPEEVQELASFLEWLHITWNTWYRDILIEYREDVREAISAVELHLADGAG
jgi:hypothetical protein